MGASVTFIVSGAVEGPLDEAVLRVLLNHVGLKSGSIYGKDGKPYLQKKVKGYNRAAYYAPWVIIIDLDHDAECAPALRQSWLPDPAPCMFLRVAVRKIEAWLLGDQNHIASFLGIPESKVPMSPERLDDPKQVMVSLASRSRRRDIREDMVPRPGSGRTVGPAYTSRLIEFVSDFRSGWRPDAAAENSDSLNRCLGRLKSLLKK